MVACFLVLPTRAQEDTNEIPRLRPLHSQLAPSFWEQHGVLFLVLGITLLILVGLIIWMLTRPEPPVVVPPAIQAREALHALPVSLPEGHKLSRVSQILRAYLRGAFDLPKAELTTTEFCQIIVTNSKFGPLLAAELADFLRDNDRRKFSAEPGAPVSLNAVTVALSLIEKGESRRAEQQVPPATASASRPS